MICGLLLAAIFNVTTIRRHAVQSQNAGGDINTKNMPFMATSGWNSASLRADGRKCFATHNRKCMAAFLHGQ